MRSLLGPGLLGLLTLLFTHVVTAMPAAVPLAQAGDQALGLHTSYLQESAGPLTLDDVLAAQARGRFQTSDSEVLTFGIAPRPVWIYLPIANHEPEAAVRRLMVEIAWLDEVELYLVHAGRLQTSYRTGDEWPFSERPVLSRYFAFDLRFRPGVSELYLRVATEDPMVVPIHLLQPSQAEAWELAESYSYGALYGFVIALLFYNAMLYAGLRHKRYILYSLYLGMFVWMNVSYTGHGFRWLWPEDTRWAQWSNPLFMALFGSSGLLFALSFLNTRELFPRAHRAVLGYLSVWGILFLVAFGTERQDLALLLAFTFATLFAFVMLGLGLMAVRSGQKPARYFMLAALCAMIGATSTALSTWGFIPFNVWTFRAVEIGMLLDATLLALALTYQFRVGQRQRQRAEALATLDPLTGINNRRAFYGKADIIWNSSRQPDEDLAVILLDIDRFKNVNDTFGHACGDQVLVNTAAALQRSVREQDVIARWGGEEFIVLLPETTLDEAAALAERLREAISTLRIADAPDELRVTASFGVAQRLPEHETLEALISAADRELYRAKETGRDRVSQGDLFDTSSPDGGDDGALLI